MKNLILTSLLLVFCLYIPERLSGQVQGKDNDVQVVLLAGQSNMAGHGNYDKLEESVKIRIAKVAHRVYLSENGNKPVPLSPKKIKPSEKYPFTRSFGPEIFVGLTLAEAHPNQDFLLIKRAQGGTALYGAWNPKWTSEKAKAIEKGVYKQGLNLCKIYIEDIHENLNALIKQGKTYTIMGMVWLQGENDATLEVAANTYGETLKKLIHKYRAEFNVSNMPFVIGQINSRYGVKNGAVRVRKAMVNVAKEGNVGLIKTSTDTSWNDYPKHKDNVHYNAKGQKRLGTAFAQEIMHLKN